VERALGEGRHLGCSGALSSSRRSVRGGPHRENEREMNAKAGISPRTVDRHPCKRCARTGPSARRPLQLASHGVATKGVRADADRVPGTTRGASFTYGPLNRGPSAGASVPQKTVCPSKDSHAPPGALLLFTHGKSSQNRGSGRFEVVLADRIRLQKSEDSSLEASLEQVSRKQTS